MSGNGDNGGTGMTNATTIIRTLKFVGLLAAALSIGACAKNPADHPSSANASAAVPGSQQDFVVNVGDRVFFESDSTELSQQAVGTLERQAQWLRTHPQYSVPIEGHPGRR